MAGSAGGGTRDEQPRGVALVHHDGVLGQRRADGRGQSLRRQGSRRSLGSCGQSRRGAVGGRTEQLGQGLERAGCVLPGTHQGVHGAPRGHQVAGLARVGEEGDGGLGLDQDEVLHPGQLGLGELGQIPQPVDGRDPGSPFQIGRKGLGQQRGAAGAADPARGVKATGAQGRPAEQECRPLTRTERPGHSFEHLGGNLG